MVTTGKSQGHTVDMTEGNALKVIINFAIPLIAASVLQQLFSLTDAMVLGIFNGDLGLAVLGTCSWPIWFQISALTNFGQAACLLVAVRFGAKDETAFKKSVGNIYFAAVVIGIVMMLGLQITAVPLLAVQDTPKEVMADAIAYLRIIFVGTVFLLIYNVLSSLLRAVGDSVTSFLSITISAVMNVVLDIVLVAGLRMGVSGAAIATVASQSVSAVICIVKLRGYREFDLEKEFLKPDRELLKEYMGICVPMLAQSVVIALGGVFVQFRINQYGTTFAAGVSAASKIFKVVETAAIALAQACASFVSQNVGACKFDRIKKAVRQVSGVSIAMAAVIGAFLLLTGKWMLSLYVTKEALPYALGSLIVFSFGLLLMYPMYALRQIVQALGNLKIPLIAAMLQLAVRVLTAQFLPMAIGNAGLYYTNVAAWFVSIVLIGLVYPGQFKKCREKYEKNK